MYAGETFYSILPKDVANQRLDAIGAEIKARAEL